MYTKVKKQKSPKKSTNNITFNEFKEMIEGFTDDEFNLVYDWLSTLRKKPSKR